MAKLTTEVDTAWLEDAMKKAFGKSKNKFNIPGFHKGKAPRAMIEKMYGEGTFYESTANEAVNATCTQAMNENRLETVSRPRISVEQIGKDKSFIYTAIITIRLEATLGEYKGIEVKKVEVAVTAEDVDVELKRVQEQNARQIIMEDRPVTGGDQTVIGFKGFVNGKSFNGDKTEDYVSTIGSHSLIDTFGEQLIGKNIKEECEVNATFPEECHAIKPAGKPAIPKVTVKKIKVKELPELSDEFADEVSEFDTPDEYEEGIEAKILERRWKEVATENEDRVIERAVADATMEIPDKMVEGQIDNMAQDTARRMQNQGPSMEMYMKYIDMIMESMGEQMQPQALKRIQTRLILGEVAKTGDIQALDERPDEETTKTITPYQMEVDKLKEYMLDRGEGQMEEDPAIQEAVDLLVAEARLV